MLRMLVYLEKQLQPMLDMLFRLEKFSRLV